MERQVRFFFLTSLLLVIVVTLFPFNFSLIGKLSVRELILGFNHISNPEDFFGNILLFIPFGFCFAWLRYLKGVKEIKIIITVAITSLSLSTIIEILQLFIPLRFSTKSDIVANGLGGLLGGIFFIVFYLCLLVSSEKRRQMLQPKRLMFLLISYLTVAICVTISCTNTTTLSNWNQNFPLVIGNEVTGDRPWRGYISQLAIFDRAVSVENIQRFLQEGNFAVKDRNSLLVSDRLSERGKYSNPTAPLPVFSWQNESLANKTKGSTATNVPLTPNHWLVTPTPPRSVTKKISQTSQFTIYTTIATNKLEQTGPARIISLSQDINSRNFTMGQQNRNLVFRLRNLLMGENGANFKLLIPNVFQDTDYHRIAVSYVNSTLKVYIDELNKFSSWQLMPEANLFRYLFSIDSDYRTMLNYKLLYYLVVFLPLGFLLGLLSLAWKGRAIANSWFFTIAIVSIVGIIQSSIAYGNKTDLGLGNLALSMAIAISTFLLVRSEIMFRNSPTFRPAP